MKNPDKGANMNHATVPQTLYVFGAKTQKRLLKASELMRYYKVVEIEVTVTNTVYNPVIKSFLDQWKGFTNLKKNAQPGEAFGLIEEELVAQASYIHTLYHEDIAAVYFCLEKAVRSTQYASSLKPYQQVKNSRGALAFIKQEYAGADTWQTELLHRDKFLCQGEWKGQTLYLLK
eukprot:12564095-Ditylum_brightwellii.AAC.1